MKDKNSVQNKKRNFKSKLKILIDIYNIPLEEQWKQFLDTTDEHMNFFFYLEHLEVFEKNTFDIKDPETYKIRYNKYIERFFKKSEYYFETENLTGKNVVDVGCGWGMLTVWYALSGAETVYAIGFPFQVEFIEKLIKRAKEKKGIDDSIRIITIAQPLETGIKTIGSLEPASADRIYYHDVFEHLPDGIFQDSLQASCNTLKKGGKLISATHNTDNSLTLKDIEIWWTKQENEKHIAQRTELIKKKVPDISNENLEKLVAGTRGLLISEFEKAINYYTSTGKIISSNKLMPAVDLAYDYICENYISPPHVVNMMKQAGFKAYCYAALMHSRRFVLFQPFARIFKNLFMNIEFFSRAVVFIGIK